MSVRRSMKRLNAGIHTLYHFTPPGNLPAICSKGIYPRRQGDDVLLLPGNPLAIWLTTNPKGNAITDRHLAYWRKINCVELLEEYEARRRLYAFGYYKNESARITLELPRKFPGLINYLELSKKIYGDRSPAIKILKEMPDTSDWWVIVAPSDAETANAISPSAIVEVASVGEQAPSYIDAVNKIQKWAEQESATR